MSISRAFFWTMFALAVGLVLNIVIPGANRSDMILGLTLFALYRSFRNERAA